MKLNKIIYAVCLASILASCDAFLTKEPESAIPIYGFPKTEKEANAILAGMYDAIQTALGVNYFTWGEVRSDNVEKNAGGADVYLMNNALTATHSSANWGDLYKVILNANIAIKYIPQIENCEEDLKNNMIAQAYTARGLMYFYLLRVWGRAPIIEEPFENKEGQQMYYKRSSIEDLKKIIEHDLNEAIRLFDNATPESCYIMSNGTAKAILTDYYMWNGDYNNAISTSDYFQPENQTTYKYAEGETQWKQIFIDPSSSNEPIFTIQWDYIKDSWNRMALEFGCADRNAKYKISEGIWNDFVANKSQDVRFAQTLDTIAYNVAGFNAISEATYSTVVNIGTNYNSKFLKWNPNKNPSGVVVYPTSMNKIEHGGFELPSSLQYEIEVSLYRYAGVMLLRAEALAKRNEGGDLSEAISIVNKIRERVGYKTGLLDPAETQQNVINAIDKERRLELWGEGVRWFDLVRTNRVHEVMDPIMIERGNNEGFGDDNYILWPIHQSAFEGNPLLRGDQNPGYSES